MNTRQNTKEYIKGKYFLFTVLNKSSNLSLFSVRRPQYFNSHTVDRLYSKQFGFRKNHSTETAIIELVTKLTDAIDKNKFTAGIFLDLSKAFDTVNHSIIGRFYTRDVNIV